MRFSRPSPLKMPTAVLQDVASAQAPANGLQTYGPISCFWSDTPFARNKQQLMQQQGTFPGLTHDLSDICEQGVPKFWARDRLQTKIQDIIHQARQSVSLPKGTASKKLCGSMASLSAASANWLRRSHGHYVAHT